jgi:thiopeptide-type bacteriocin biosynthesis protein
MTTEDIRWHSLHLHRYDRQDELLVAAVAPLLARPVADGHFFLRYWKGGHHIRLRLRTTVAVRDRVAAELRDHCARDPAGLGFDVEAFREAQTTMAALENEGTGEVQPPDTVHVAAYEPEYAKYGGPAGVGAAERFFAASTDAVLRELPALVERPARRLGLAFSTMLGALTAIGHPPEETARFFADYCVLWSPYVFDAYLSTWPQVLTTHAPALERHAAALLAAPDPGPVGTAARTALDDVRRAGPEVLAAVTLAGVEAPPQCRRQALLASYLHTHNNRLGLIPQQEALLGYLGHHVLAAEPDRTLLDRLIRHRARSLRSI